MIHDRMDNLEVYSSLVPLLDRLDDILFSYAQEGETFECNEGLCTLFVPQEEGCQIATSWRESAISRDVTAAISPEVGTFVLFLPGERFIYRGAAKCRLYTLE